MSKNGIQAAVLALAVACKAEQPCDGFSVGSRWGVTILSNPTVGGLSCGPSFDLVGGQVLEADIVASVDEQGLCYEGIASFASLGSWTWTLEEAFTVSLGGDSASANGYYDATNGTCTGQVRISLYPNGGHVLSPPDGGGPTPWLLSRRFQASVDAGSASCPTLCNDSFAVNLRPM